MESKLPFDTLGKIWDLADQDKDGMLNRHEFVVVTIKICCLNGGVHVVTNLKVIVPNLGLYGVNTLLGYAFSI